MTLSCNEVQRCHGKTVFRGGRCGLRADWTEAHFKDIKTENRDTYCLVIAPIGGSVRQPASVRTDFSRRSSVPRSQPTATTRSVRTSSRFMETSTTRSSGT